MRVVTGSARESGIIMSARRRARTDATQADTDAINWKAWSILGIVIAILILLAIDTGGVWSTWSMVSTLSNAPPCPVEDEACSDFDPCHVCVKRTLCAPPAGGQPVEECGRDFYCDCRPVPNGTCCNEQDYCYLPDPEKRCVYGTCVSPNQTLCRGACPYNTGTDTPCNATIPILQFGGEYPATETFCVLASCVTLFTVNGQWAQCDSFLDRTSSNVSRATAACAACQPFQDPTTQTTSCMCQWNCAPFGGFPFGRRKRAAEQSDSNVTIYFPLPPSLTYSEYSQLNAQLNNIVAQQVAALRQH